MKLKQGCCSKKTKGMLSVRIRLVKTVLRKIIGDEQITSEGSIANTNSCSTGFLGFKAHIASMLSIRPPLVHMSGRAEMLMVPPFLPDSVRFLSQQYPEIWLLAIIIFCKTVMIDFVQARQLVRQRLIKYIE